jgi:glycine cleavage system protein P-like pyridoxal-binding family
MDSCLTHPTRLAIALTHTTQATIALDRFCEAMISIRQEISAIENSKVDQEDNLLKNALHTAETLITSDWQLEKLQ